MPSKIILVDDDRTSADLIKMLLEMDGFSVTACPTLDLARSAAENGVDAFVVDCNLAGGENGIDLLREVRGGRTAAGDQTIFIVTSGDDRRSRDADQYQANKFMLKPYPPSTLTEELRKLLI